MFYLDEGFCLANGSFASFNLIIEIIERLLLIFRQDSLKIVEGDEDHIGMTIANLSVGSSQHGNDPEFVLPNPSDLTGDALRVLAPTNNLGNMPLCEDFVLSTSIGERLNPL